MVRGFRLPVIELLGFLHGVKEQPAAPENLTVPVADLLHDGMPVILVLVDGVI
jgi:hypothetical protein